MKEQLGAYFEHVIMAPEMSYEQVAECCNQAIQYQLAAVCVPPCFVEAVAKEYPSLTVATMIDYPNGYETHQVRMFSAKEAVSNGAKEIALVLSGADIKNGQFVKVVEELKELKQCCENAVFKVVVDKRPYTEGELIALCQILTEAGGKMVVWGMDYEEDAAFADVSLLQDMLGRDVKWMTSGRVEEMDELEMLLKGGCSRIAVTHLPNYIIME